MGAKISEGQFHGYLLRDGDFTQIDFRGSIETRAFDINRRGEIAGFYRSADSKFHGYLLREGEFTSIDFHEAVSTFANGINRRGDIVGRYQTQDGRSHGFLLTRKGRNEDNDR